MSPAMNRRNRILNVTNSVGTIASRANFYRFNITHVPIPIKWQGQTTCHGNVPITVYTPEGSSLLSIGTKLYFDRELKTPYSNPYFVYSNVRYTVVSGTITLVEQCNLYML